jgi:hypothetical protein
MQASERAVRLENLGIPEITALRRNRRLPKLDRYAVNLL